VGSISTLAELLGEGVQVGVECGPLGRIQLRRGLQRGSVVRDEEVGVVLGAEEPLAHGGGPGLWVVDLPGEQLGETRGSPQRVGGIAPAGGVT
jgi:hypothetical protein